MTHRFDPSILREYDIRGIVGQTLSGEDAYAIGRAFGGFKSEWGATSPRIAVGRDGRVSSVELEAALVKGLTESGATVLRVGLGPTPMLYFATRSLELDGGIMVTGSHNPPEHNGFKFMLGAKSFFGDDIRKLGEMAAQGTYHSGKKGTVMDTPVEEAYVETLFNAYRGTRPLRIAWDAGNGAAGHAMQLLAHKLPGEHFLLYPEIDGSFPNHHPDPTVAENLEDVIRAVRERKCDVGVAFDGDGDRIGAVDETGEIIWGDQLLALLAAEVIAGNKGATIIADVKASETLFDEVKRLGGTPLMWKTGHSLIKTKMAETGALLAGEMSGHIFFADRYYGYDDGLYAAVRLLSLLAASGRKLSELRAHMPKTYATPELRIPCGESEKFAIIDAAKARLKQSGASVNDIDGVRVATPDGWWLLRASNTQAILVARCESTSKEGLAKLMLSLHQELSHSGIQWAA